MVDGKINYFYDIMAILNSKMLVYQRVLSGVAAGDPQFVNWKATIKTYQNTKKWIIKPNCPFSNGKDSWPWSSIR